MGTTTAVRAVIYLRLSDLRLIEPGPDGIEKAFCAREKDLRELAKRVGATVVKVIRENDLRSRGKGRQQGVSAFKRKKITLPDGRETWRVIRKGFDEILRDLWVGTVTLLLTEDLDRMVRDPRDLEDLIEVAERRGISARSLSGSLTLTNGGTDSEITMARIMVTMANKSSRDTARRVSEARRRAAENNQPTGGGRKFGFEIDGMTPIPAEAAVVLDCSTRVLQIDAKAKEKNPNTTKLTSLRSLALELRAGDVPTVTGAQWSAETLRDILLRPRNAGITVHLGEELGRFTSDPIVPEDIYRAVVALLTDPSRTTGSGPAAKWQGSGVYLCGRCDDGETYMEATGGGTACVPYYRCEGHNHVRRTSSYVDEMVSAAVVARLSRADAVDLIPTVDVPDVDVPGLQAESARIRASLKSLGGMLVRGLIDEDQLLDATQVGRKRLAEIKDLLDVTIVESPLAPLIGVDDVAAEWAKQPVHIRREIISTLFVVKILPTVKGAKFVPGTRFSRSSVVIEPKPAPVCVTAPVETLPAAA